MNNQMVAHNWANQTNSHGKGSNFFYDGKSIYSYGYHFEVGRIVETEKGNEIVLLNNASYSVSTSKHQGYARQACNHIESFSLPLNKDARLPFTNYNFVAFFNHYGNIVIESSKKAMRSRKYGDLHLKDAVKAVDDWNKLRSYFPSLCEGIKRLTLPSDIQVKKLNDQDKAERAKERKEKQARIERDENAWLNYDQNYVSRMARCLLRQRQVSYIPEQGCAPQSRLVDEVETSHGARVPLQDAKLFFNAIKRFKDSPKACLDRFKVGNFRLSNLTPNGANIGCHFIAWSEMERFATQMGWQA
jgi:hypothetical protein